MSCQFYFNINVSSHFLCVESKGRLSMGIGNNLVSFTRDDKEKRFSRAPHCTYLSLQST